MDHEERIETMIEGLEEIQQEADVLGLASVAESIYDVIEELRQEI
jgi:hypothetical protein